MKYHLGRTLMLYGLVLGGLVPSGSTLFAEAERDEPFAESEELLERYHLGFEVRAHYRDSDSQRFPIPLFILGEQLSLETVDAGSHTELSVITIEGLAQWREDLAAKVKIDFIDRYDRNPTSEDREVDIDEAWIRFGREPRQAEVPDRRTWYAKLGKFGKFERQDDRLLESYGLVSTSFNRLEDVGLEVGVDITPNLYLKASFTQGNPVFFRDANVLAGDNGTSVFAGPVALPLPVSEIKSGLPIFYDADVDTIDFEHPEVGFGLGWRWSSPTGFVALDALAWGYERELADEVDLDNTIYEGDLDLLLGPPGVDGRQSLPITSDEKSEIGANLWLYVGDFSLFAQYVDQDLAGLDRTGFEVETTWTFELPTPWTIGGRQLFPRITPSIRYSELDPKFGRGNFPVVSVIWDWEKVDYGLRFTIIDEVDITVEWQDHTFIRLGREESNDEFLITLRLGLERGWPRG